MPKRAEELPAHEELLLDYAERLGRHLPGRRAIHLHLCQLKPHNKRPHHIRIAASSFDGLVQRHEGQCFTLANRDIVVVVRDASVGQIDEVVLKLRFLFSDDPLVAQEDSGEETQERFVTWYDLEDADYPRFLAMARRMRAAAKKAAAEEAEAVDEPAKDDGPEPTVPLDPEKLDQLEKQLVGADIGGMLRRQPICAMLPGQPAKPVFNEVFVSMEELRKRVLPEVNLFSSRWLFQHMTEVLDLRLEDGSGLDIVPDLQETRPDGRIIMLTGYGNIATAVAAVKLGAVDYISKPADADAIEMALLARNGEPPPPPEDPMSADRVRWEHIQRVYELCDRNVSETARRLKMHRRTLQRILAKRSPKE